MNAPYSTKYDPPAPVLDVLIAAPQRPAMKAATTALIDTGADRTVLGSGLAAELFLPLLGYVEVAGITGGPETVPMWLAIIEAERFRFELSVAEIGAETILGRDVLNRLSLHLDGPRLRTLIS